MRYSVLGSRTPSRRKAGPFHDSVRPLASIEPLAPLPSVESRDSSVVSSPPLFEKYLRSSSLSKLKSKSVEPSAVLVPETSRVAGNEAAYAAEAAVHMVAALRIPAISAFTVFVFICNHPSVDIFI